MADDIFVETRNLTKIYRDFWGRKKNDGPQRPEHQYPAR